MIRAALAFLVGFTLVIAFHGCSFARDLGQWENTDPQIKKWYQSLLQPDTISGNGSGGLEGTSCCGEADSYYVDVFVRSNWVDGQQIIAVINDDRDDAKLQRFHEENGTQYVVPPKKIVGELQRVGNPTGRAVLFLGTVSLGGPGGAVSSERSKPRRVLCFVDDSGF